MKYQIKNRYTREIIVEKEAETLREVVEKNKSKLWKADLQEADLRGADLQEADLWGADLRRADLREAKIKSSQIKDLIRGLGIIIVEE